MQEIYIEPVVKVIRNKIKLEKELQVKITNRGKLVFVDGPTENEYIALKILEAINLGFSVDRSLLLKKENTELHKINIKDVTKRHDLERVRARIIGTRGKTLGTINNLTQCAISLKDNQVGIIGDCEEIEDATQAIKSIIHGSKQSNVYARAEKQRKRKNLDSKNLDIKNELRSKKHK